MSYDSLLIHEVYLTTKYSSQDSLGYWQYTTSSSTTATRCRLSPVTYEEIIELPGRWEDVSFRGFFPSGTNISRGDEITDGTDTYRVKEKLSDSSGHHITTLLVKL